MAPAEGGHSRLKLPEESLGLVALERAAGIATRITVLSKSPIMEAQSFLSGALPSECHQPGGKQYPQPPDSLSPHLVELGAQLGPSHAQQIPAERTTNSELHVATKRLPRAGH